MYFLHHPQKKFPRRNHSYKNTACYLDLMILSIKLLKNLKLPLSWVTKKVHNCFTTNLILQNKGIKNALTISLLLKVMNTFSRNNVLSCNKPTSIRHLLDHKSISTVAWRHISTSSKSTHTHKKMQLRVKNQDDF